MDAKTSRELAEIVNELNKLMPGRMFGSHMVVYFKNHSDEEVLRLMRIISDSVKALVEKKGG